MPDKPITIDMKQVASSNIKRIGWKNNVLRVQFKNSGIYDYQEVSKEIYETMITSDSIGSFFARNIRGNYKYIKIS